MLPARRPVRQRRCGNLTTHRWRRCRCLTRCPPSARTARTPPASCKVTIQCACQFLGKDILKAAWYADSCSNATPPVPWRTSASAMTVALYLSVFWTIHLQRHGCLLPDCHFACDSARLRAAAPTDAGCHHAGHHLQQQPVPGPGTPRSPGTFSSVQSLWQTGGLTVSVTAHYYDLDLTIQRWARSFYPPALAYRRLLT